MGFFDDISSVNEYIKMADGFDGANLIEQLSQYLEDGASLLELGMGPGKDLDLLRRRYKVCGSDMSRVFLDLYREQHPDADLLCLDAVTLKTERRFHAIYSNKVLHHLSKEDLKTSIQRQAELLHKGGILCHSFWKGDHQEKMGDLFFQYYQEEELLTVLGGSFQILKSDVYKEFEEDDSILIIARLKG